MPRPARDLATRTWGGATPVPWRVIAVIACAGVLIFGLAKARAEVRAVPQAAAETEALEGEAEAAGAEAQEPAAEAAVAEAEAVIAAAQLRLFGEAGS